MSRVSLMSEMTSTHTPSASFGAPNTNRPVSRSPGPSQKEPALITSTWGIGWKTPVVMTACYFLAFIIAIAHLLLFRYINGKEADGPDRVAPQSYITTASNVLANLFGFALRAALAVAFAQYLWHLFRVETMKVSTIELLFTIRTNLFMLIRPAVIQASPVLFALAALMWTSQIVTSFPPGALTVITGHKITYAMKTVPYYNASYMGNASGVDANRYSLAALNPAPIPPQWDGFTVGDNEQDGKENSLMVRLTVPVMVNGETAIFPSPCGVNCSYSTQFEGPYLKCNTTSTTYRVGYDDFFDASLARPWEVAMYFANWNNPRNSLDTEYDHGGYFAPYNGKYSIATFNFTTINPLYLEAANTQNSSVVFREDQLVCSPERAKYTINNTYTNNIHSRTVTTEPIERLINLALLTHYSAVLVPGFGGVNGTLGTTPANWSADTLTYFRDSNHVSIIESMMSYINGTMLATVQFQHEEDFYRVLDMPSSVDIGKIYAIELSQPLYVDQREHPLAGKSPIADVTRLNSNFGHFSPTERGNPAFNITQDLLNEQLLNVTLSMMQGMALWNTTTNATISTATNVYKFSNPLMLILPYFITLAVSVPFILLGSLALLKNGVSAIDGGFMQIVATSTGSAALDNAAAGGCLGGNESVAQDLKDLKIRFGEIKAREDAENPKRAGFGTENEISSLQKGAKYGIARWI